MGEKLYMREGHFALFQPKCHGLTHDLRDNFGGGGIIVNIHI